MATRPNISVWALLVAVLALAVLDLAFGGVRLNLGEFFSQDGTLQRQIVFNIRLPRVLCAVLSGAALSLAGCQMQAVFRNPLADPHILGLSSGSALGAALAIGLGALSVAGGAFIGACLASVCIVAVSSRFKGVTVLLIFGVLLGFVFSAVTTLCQYFSSEESLKLYHSWVSGSFSASGWDGVTYIALALLLGLFLALSNLKGLDIILFGEDFALAGGAPIGLIRIKAILSCCIMTAVVTAFCGPIGFVGIIGPHLARALTGKAAHRWIVFPSILIGGGLALIADAMSQVFSVPVPAGATMALAGVPVIMYIILGKRLWF